jgi:uncharacterized protein DUF6600
VTRSRVLVLVCLAASVAAGWSLPATAAEIPAASETQRGSVVSFASFSERLSLFGRWFRHPEWGEVWQPDAGPGFRPYFFGYWENTEEHGWFWVSNEPYGGIVYHFGRWIFDTKDGWLWLPGYVWGPSWVVWRESGDAIGWMPMPPGLAGDDGLQPIPNDDTYGYRALNGSAFVAGAFFDLWTFVTPDDFGRSNRRRYVTRHDILREDFRRSHDATQYRDENGFIADRSLDDATRHARAPQPARRFLRPGASIVTIAEGQDIARREHANAASPGVAEGATPSRRAPNSNASRDILGKTLHGATPLPSPVPRFGFNPPVAPSVGLTPPPDIVPPLESIPQRDGTFYRPRGAGVSGIGPHTDDRAGRATVIPHPDALHSGFQPPAAGFASPAPLAVPVPVPGPPPPVSGQIGPIR